jgi:hypothetical protein
MTNRRLRRGPEVSAKLWRYLEELAECVEPLEQAKKRAAQIKREARAKQAQDEGDTYGDLCRAQRDFKSSMKIATDILTRAIELPPALPLLHRLEAVWRFNNSGFQFLLGGGALLNWWPQSRTIHWSGKIRGKLAHQLRRGTLAASLAQYENRVGVLGPATRLENLNGRVAEQHKVQQRQPTKIELMLESFARGRAEVEKVLREDGRGA